GNWLAALLTLGIFSILYKENVVYRIAEHMFVGLSAAHGIVVTWQNTIKPGIQTNMMKNGQWWELIPIAIGLMIYCGAFKNIAWLNRIPIAFWMGYNAGLAISVRTIVPWMQQIIQTFKPFVVFNKAGGFDFLSSFNNVVFVVAVLSTLVYFFFTREHKGVLRHSATFGRWMMMIAFGASFGNTVMARISLLLGRVQFMLGPWLGIIKQ
ncbi:MAG: hypothetical protein ACM3ZQ_02640, partial [Bacillota bacterium]